MKSAMTLIAALLFAMTSLNSHAKTCIRDPYVPGCHDAATYLVGPNHCVNIETTDDGKLTTYCNRTNTPGKVPRSKTTPPTPKKQQRLAEPAPTATAVRTSPSTLRDAVSDQN